MNIAGGGDGDDHETVPQDDGGPVTRAEAVVDVLGDRYWRTAYGGRDAFKCLVRTVLGQNTSDEASQPAHDALLARYDGTGTGLAAALADADRTTVRDRLLAFDGVGPKTADCVLLFAGGRDGTFPVDTHVHRIARRLGLAPADADHETVREHLEADVPGPK